jgi:hypothetical protein
MFLLILVSFAALLGIFAGYVTPLNFPTKGPKWRGVLRDAILGAVGLVLGISALVVASRYARWFDHHVILGLLVVLLFGPVLSVLATRTLLSRFFRHRTPEAPSSEES